MLYKANCKITSHYKKGKYLQFHKVENAKFEMLKMGLGLLDMSVKIHVQIIKFKIYTNLKFTKICAHRDASMEKSNF